MRARCVLLAALALLEGVTLASVGAAARPRGEPKVVIRDAKPTKPVNQVVTLEEEEEEEDPGPPPRKQGPVKLQDEEDEQDEAPPPRRTTRKVADDEPADEADEERPPPRARARRGGHAVWLQLGFLQDLGYVSGTDACTARSQVSGDFTCIRARGTQYHGTPLRGAAGSPDALALGPTRLALTAAFPLGGAFSVATRVAYAIAGQGPQPDGGRSFFPLHLELQGHLWLTGPAFSKDGPGLFIVVSGGLSQVDLKASVVVREDTTVPPPVSQIDNPPVQTLDAWQKSGLGFAGAGLGAFLPVSDSFGFLTDLRGSALFPSAGFALGLSISAALGL